ncbi:hypothetical protein D3OALGA1CA_429 [Olavius algarvensis associated proteobacterium Delta 3]|nr:hypothetical protein D3OALGA1CA_429 [Olavius algarvensis associated proteobacterium Delta 3]
MNYADWICRERRLRVQILKGAPQVASSGNVRICQNCGEICLCHEITCPNCGDKNIKPRNLPGWEREYHRRIRCALRYKKMNQEQWIDEAKT